ncbi:MAG: SurA N-terminal domain-containing protein [Proteobacteria bacterium]|nr:SurA N-terminal domain-containing protein [Pseudomonadota bacterium]
MLQRISDGLRGQKWLAWIIIGAIALVFIAWGATGVVDFGFGPTAVAAKVDGEKITAQQAIRAWSDRQSQWQQQFKTEIPADEQAAQQDAVLEQLVLRNLLQQRLDDRGFAVSQEQLHRAMQDERAFQVDGVFNPQVAKAALAQAGYSEPQYQAEKRIELKTNQLQNGIRVSHFLTPAEMQRVIALQSQEREVRYLALPAEKFVGDAPIDQAAVEQYYESNRERFLTPESAAIEYGELRLEQLAAQVQPAAADLQALYDSDKTRFVLPERRRARHILFNAPDDKSAAAALEQAQKVLAEARAGKDFAALATQYSQDAGSAAQGGDLGWSDRNAFVGPFADALFAMQTNEVRGPVRTQFGYHIIRLDGIQAGKTKTFEEALPELESRYRNERAAEMFGDRQEELQRKLEQPSARFDDVVGEFGLVRGEVANYQRGVGGPPLGLNKDLQDAVFSERAVSGGRIAGPVALGDDWLVIARVREHRKATPKPLADVRDEIVTALRQERGAKAALAAAQAALPTLGNDVTLESLAKGWGLEAAPAQFVGRGDPSVPAAVRTRAFEAVKPAGKPVNGVVELDDGSGAVALFQLTQVRTAAMTNPDMLGQLANFVSMRAGAGDLTAYLEEIRRNATVVKHPRVFEQ